MTQMFKEDKGKVLLKDKEGNELASFKLDYDSEDAINISKWKAKVKGSGYGRELIQKFVKSKPDLYSITTDGFTEKGEANIQKALPGFKIINKRRGYGGSTANIMRQDVIDYFVDRQKENPKKRFFINVNPEFHS